MSFNTFYAGLTGLRSYSSSLNTIGNNLANLNTTGFKASRTQFAELVSAATGPLNGAGAVSQQGLGVRITAVQGQFSQGALQSTAVLTDLAIQGNGFFVTENALGTQLFTRAGSFSFDSTGYLVDPAGNRVQAYTQLDANNQIISGGDLGDVQIPIGLVAPPQATDILSMQLNLDASSDPAGTPFVSVLSVYDTLGGARDISFEFTPIDADSNGVIEQWDWRAFVANEDLAGAGSTGTTDVGSGSLAFDGTGALVSPASDPTLNIPQWVNGAPAQAITWELRDSTGNLDLLTSYQSSSVLRDFSQNGFSTGELQTLSIDQTGLISGVFTNGRSLELARVAVANFNNPSGLLKQGSNTFVPTIGSGPAVIGEAELGGRGSVIAQALELSNVDITEEFTDLIVAERGYQSNSRVITTTDEIIQEALSIKR